MTYRAMLFVGIDLIVYSLALLAAALIWWLAGGARDPVAAPFVIGFALVVLCIWMLHTRRWR